MNKKYISIILLIPFIIIISFSGCGVSGLAAPTDLAAEEGNPDYPNRTQISWLPVENAGIYYVYRAPSSDSAEADYDYAGFSVTSYVDDESSEIRFSFIESFEEGEGGTFAYRVTAAAATDTVVESAMSDAVEASTYSGSWSSVSSTNSQITDDAVSLDLVYSGGVLYAVTASTSGTISVKQYADEEDSEEDNPPKVWTALSGSPGSITTSKTNPVSAFYSGDLYVAYTFDSDLSTGTAADDDGTINLKYYDSDSDSWKSSLNMELADNLLDHVSSISSGAFATKFYTSAVNLDAVTDATPDEIIVYSDGSSVADISQLPIVVSDFTQMFTNNSSLYVGYTASTGGLYMNEINTNTDVLQDSVTVSTDTVGGSLAAFVSGSGIIYAVYITSGNALVVRKYEDSSWTAYASITDANAAYTGTLASAWYNGYLYVFYVDGSDKAWVKYFDEDEGWQNAARGSSELITDAGSYSGFNLTTAGTSILYASYIDDLDSAWLKGLE